MSDWAGSRIPSTTLLSSFGRRGSGVYPFGNPSSGNSWGASNRAYYIPVLLEDFATAYKMEIWPTVQSGNLDVGIYTEKGARLVSSGSTAVGVANDVQVIDIADTLLVPGLYFLAAVVDNTTANFRSQSSVGAGFLNACGMQCQDSAMPLPANATFAAVNSAFMPLLVAHLTSAAV